MIKDLKSSNTGDVINPNIVSENIPSGAVTTPKINDGSVTTDKIANGSVTYDKLATALKNLIDGKASSSDLTIVQNALTSHTSNTSNPHNVTKAQVGLGNVDNTSDANKPISTATQTALNGKQATLTFDNAPTEDSANPVKSGGVYTALSGKADKSTTPTLSGNNTFSGENVFSNVVNFDNDVEVSGAFTLNETNIYDLFAEKQNRFNLYKHTIKLKYNDNKSFVIVEIFKTNATPITTRSELCNYFNVNDEILANGYTDYSDGANIISVTILGKNPTETDPLNPFLFLDTHFVYNDTNPYTYDTDSLDIYSFDTLSIIQIM